jgi:hypothetical protein
MHEPISHQAMGIRSSSPIGARSGISALPVVSSLTVGVIADAVPATVDKGAA